MKVKKFKRQHYNNKIKLFKDNNFNNTHNLIQCIEHKVFLSRSHSKIIQNKALQHSM